MTMTQNELEKIYDENDNICTECLGGCSAVQYDGDNFIVKYNDNNGANNKTTYTHFIADADKVFEQSGIQRLETLLRLVDWK
jgi:hypothetical protein